MASSSRAREARIDLTVGKNGLTRGLRDAKKGLRGFASDAKKSFVDTGKKLAGGLLGGVGALAGIGGGLGIASIVGDVVDFERAMTRFQIATDSTPEKMGQLRAQLSKVSRETGVGRDQLLASSAAYVALTGDADGARDSIGVFAKVNRATGASMEDIAATAAAMKNNLKIDPKDFEAGFSALAVQGKAGAVELRDLSTLLAGVAPQFAAFKGGGGADGLATMGAALQVIKNGFGSAAESATGLRSLMVAVNRNADKFQKAGVKIYDKDPKTGVKRLRSFVDIIDSIANSPLAKDPQALQKAFGADEAARAFQQLVLNRSALDDLIAKSKDKSAIDRDAATYQQSAAGRLEIAWNKIKMAIAEALTPERIAAFAGALEHIVEMIDTITTWLGRPQEVAGAVGGLITGAGDLRRLEDERFKANWNLMYGEGGKARTADEAAQVMAQRDRTYNQMLSGRPVSPDEYWSARGRARASSPYGPNFEPGAERILAEIAAQRQRDDAAVQRITVAVSVGEEVVAKATAAAKAHRTRPGGV